MDSCFPHPAQGRTDIEVIFYFESMGKESGSSGNSNPVLRKQDKKTKTTSRSASVSGTDATVLEDKMRELVTARGRENAGVSEEGIE